MQHVYDILFFLRIKSHISRTIKEKIIRKHIETLRSPSHIIWWVWTISLVKVVSASHVYNRLFCYYLYLFWGSLMTHMVMWVMVNSLHLSSVCLYVNFSLLWKRWIKLGRMTRGKRSFRFVQRILILHGDGLLGV
jgi:hypothetical protein